MGETLHAREEAEDSRMRAQLLKRPDEELIADCLRGSQVAWTELIAKYKQLVYSIPLRYRIPAQDAADIFQSVWADVFHELPNLRQTASFSSWLITTTSRKCFHWKRKSARSTNLTNGGEANLADPRVALPELREELEREQMLREAVLRLPERCQQMLKLLFYQQPPISYRDLAQQLGLAEGSIGFIRGRCLEKLRQELEEIGF